MVGWRDVLRMDSICTILPYNDVLRWQLIVNRYLRGLEGNFGGGLRTRLKKLSTVAWEVVLLMISSGRNSWTMGGCHC
jgi:hypothetical protein